MNSNYFDYKHWRGHLPFSLALCGAALLLAGCGGGGSNSQPAPPLAYTITDLGVLSQEAVSYATGINSAGHVTGQSTSAPLSITTPPNSVSTSRAYLYNGRTLQDVGAPDSIALGVNNKGDVLLFNWTTNQAFLYSQGSLAALNGLSFPPVSLIFPQDPRAINDSDQIAARMPVAASAYHAALYANGAFQDLGALPSGGNSNAVALNNKGQVVGDAELGTGTSLTVHAALFANGVVTDLGTLPGDVASSATGISDTGVIIGSSGTATDHAFLIVGGRMTRLGTLPGDTGSDALAVNNAGDVVGFSSVLNPQFETAMLREHAFLYRNGAMINLTDHLPGNSGWTLTEATGINDAGQICGTGQHNGQPRAFLLTPQ